MVWFESIWDVLADTLMCIGGIAGFILALRARQVRAWFMLVFAILAGARLVLAASGHTDDASRRYSLVASFALLTADELVAYAQSRRLGAPKKARLWLALVWLLAIGLYLID